MQRYLLARHAFVCMPGEQAILLDLHSDSYIALDVETSRCLGEIVTGWPTPLCHYEPLPTNAHKALGEHQKVPLVIEPDHRLAAAHASVEQLLRRKLITTDPCKGKPAAPIVVPPPLDTLLSTIDLQTDANTAPQGLRAAHMAAFIAATAAAALWLRMFSIEWIVNTIAARTLTTDPECPPPDPISARELVSSFYRLRPFLFSAHNACLFDSLALILFLRRLGLFPRWIFGIRVGPFAAHCWVQQGPTVFNDSVEHIRSYTPIMLV